MANLPAKDGTGATVYIKANGLGTNDASAYTVTNRIEDTSGTAINPATSTNQSVLIGHVDGIETLLTAIGGNVDGLESFTDGLETSLASLLAELQGKADLLETQPVSFATLPTGTNNIGDVDIETFESSADVTMQSAAIAVGNGITLPVAGYGTAVIQITGTFVGTINFEGTANGVDWVSISATQIGNSLITPVASTPGIFRLSCSGLSTLRARISAYTSGSITAVGRTTNAPFGAKAIAVASLPSNRVFAADLTLDTAAYASGDVLGDILEITSAVLTSGGTATLQSITVIDENNQKQPFDLVFFSQTVAVGTKNSPWAVSSANLKSANAQYVPIESADYKTAGSAAIATITPPPIGLQPSTGTSVFVGTISRGTGTYTAAGLRLIITIARNN